MGTLLDVLLGAEKTPESFVRKAPPTPPTPGQTERLETVEMISGEKCWTALRSEAREVGTLSASGQESLECERRFGQLHARLFPFIGRKVRTPAGPGTLLQVFADRCTVLFDSELSRCARFAPGEIEPVSWEIP